jgi:hypothetical protein
MSKANKHMIVKQEILNVMSKYKDEYGNVDTSKFREEHKDQYSKIPYYFGNIENALIALRENNPNIVIESSNKEKDSGGPTNRATLRNKLAYSHLLYLRKNHTFEEIGQMYGGVSRAHVRQLMESLEASVGHLVNKDEEKKQIN